MIIKNEKAMSNNDKKRFLHKHYVAPIIVAIIAGIIVSLFGYFVLQDKSISDTAIDQETKMPLTEQREEQQNEEQDKSTKSIEKIITISETGSASHYYADEAIKNAKDNALNNLRKIKWLTDLEIRSSVFSEPKIDSLPDNIRATVEISVNIKEK